MQMYKVGQLLKGTVLRDLPNGEMEEVEVQGTFMFRTDDPEEHIQDVVIELPCGKVQYIDEQYVRIV